MPEWKDEITKRLSPLKLAPECQAEIAEELAQHLDDRFKELVSSGATEENAHRLAVDELLDKKFLARRWRSVKKERPRGPGALPNSSEPSLLAATWQDARHDARQVRGMGFAAALAGAILRDLRGFFRTVRRDLLHWGAAVLILGVAAGATAGVYALINTMVLHPLPIPNLDRVVSIGGLTNQNLPTTDPLAWWGRAHSIEYLADYYKGDVAAQLKGWQGAATTTLVTRDYFHVWGVGIFRGRDFEHDDQLPAENHVAILSYAFWKSHFAGQPLPLGSTVQLNGTPHTIVGIAPRNLDGLDSDLWVPQCADPAQSLKLSEDPNPDVEFGGGMIGRLRKGATSVQAHDELMDLQTRSNEAYARKTRVHLGESLIGVASLTLAAASVYGPALAALLLGSVLILLVAGADCSGFLMGQAARRTKEVTIRRMLGASRLSIFRQALLEALGLGLCSGLVGVAVANVILVACERAFPIYFVHLRERTLIGPEVFLGCLALGAAVGLIAGSLPGRRMASQDVTQVLKEDSGPLLNRRGKWLRGSIVVVQVALTFALVMGATLTIRMARKFFGNGEGYTISNVFATRLSIPVAQTPEKVASARRPKQTTSGEDPR